MTAAAEKPRESTVRTIDSGELPQRYARGWHCLGLVDQFKDDKPRQCQPRA